MEAPLTAVKNGFSDSCDSKPPSPADAPTASAPELSLGRALALADRRRARPSMGGGSVSFWYVVEAASASGDLHLSRRELQHRLPLDANLAPRRKPDEDGRMK